MKCYGRVVVLIALMVTFAVLPACGNKGPLVLPPPKSAVG